MPHTHIRSVCNRSPPNSQNCFPAWSPCCAWSHASGNYVPAVYLLLLHPVRQSWSLRSTPPSHRTLPSLRAPGRKYPVLQAPSGPTWERVGFSGMGWDCSNPLPGWLPWTINLLDFQSHAGLDRRLTRQLKLMGVKILLSSVKNLPPWTLSSPSWMQEPPPPTQRTEKSTTWSNWDSTSASGHFNTPSARATSGQYSSTPSRNSCSSLGTIFYQLIPQSNTYSMPHISSSPWTARRITSKVRLSLTSDQSPRKPDQSKRA